MAIQEVRGSDILPFLLGGRCACVIMNENTGNRFEYYINKPKNENPKFNKDGFKTYFISIRIGKSLEYAGHMSVNIEEGKMKYFQGRKGAVSGDNQAVKALMYVMTHTNCMPECVKVMHLGKCGRCGRKLTDPESIQRGLGPTCASKIGVSKFKLV